MKKALIITAMIVGSFGISESLYAQRGMMQEGPMRERMQQRMEEMRHERNVERRPLLSEEQREAIKQQNLEHMKATTPLRNKMNELQAKQKSLLSAEKPNRKEIDKNLEEIASVQSQLRKLQVERQLAFRETLTEEQRIRFDAMRANVEQRSRAERIQMTRRPGMMQGRPGMQGRSPMQGQGWKR